MHASSWWCLESDYDSMSCGTTSGESLSLVDNGVSQAKNEACY